MAKDLKKSMSAAIKAGDLYYMKGKVKMLAVTKEMLDKWKKDNKGNYDGKALTAYANAKGKKIKPVEKSLRPKLRGEKSTPKPAKKGSGAQHKRSKVDTGLSDAYKELKTAETAIADRLADNAAFRAKVAAATVKQRENIEGGKTVTVTPSTAMSQAATDAVDRSGTSTKGRVTPALKARQDALAAKRAAAAKKNKGGPVSAKPKGAYMGGGMAKKKGASMYNKGGAAKKR
jgi:hypothetical protein